MRSEPNPAESDEALRRAFVTVLGESRPVGAAVLVTPTTVLTCAHVVNSALGRHRFEPSQPPSAARVRLRFPHVDRHGGPAARVLPHCWRPPRSAAGRDRATPPAPGAVPYYGDLALLELDSPAPAGAEPAPFLALREGNEVVAQWAGGHALTTLLAVPRVQAHPWTALDIRGGSVTEGFSGGPLWDRERGAVVGLVVAAHEPARTATGGSGAVPSALYAIGLNAIESELPAMPPVAVPAAARGRQQLLTALERLLPGRHEVLACEERLAARLSRASLGPAADVERLAGLAMGVRRGVPELLNVVYEQLCDAGPGPLAGHPDWARALAVARVASPRELLAPGARRNLDALLAQCRRPGPAALIRAVLPYADDPVRPRDLAEAADVLERHDPAPGRTMPPLLRAVAEISAAERPRDPGLADELDAWADRVAPRLGVPAAALDQLRADIAPPPGGPGDGPGDEAAEQPPRVQIELLPDATGRLFTYQIWVCDGAGRHETVLTRDTDVPRERVVEDIRHVLRTGIDEYPQTALLEFFLAPAWLRLDVDAWEFPGGPGEDGFRPGLVRRVVLRSTERTRETYAGWRRRSSAPPSRPLLLDQQATRPAVAQARLERSPDTGTVVICCERAEQGRLLRACLQAGVHTVLWHRERHGDRLALDLLALVGELSPGHVPEAVRQERAKALADPDCPDHHGHRLSLLHDGPDHRPPPLAPAPWALTGPGPVPTRRARP